LERREQKRYRIWLPVKLRTERGEGLAVTYDISDKGVLMLAAEGVPVGARVTATFDVPGEPPIVRTVTGAVVRAELNKDDPHGLWPHRIAVVFEEPMEAFRSEIEAFARSSPPPFGEG
jgi:hypothetical protein